MNTEYDRIDAEINRLHREVRGILIRERILDQIKLLRFTLPMCAAWTVATYFLFHWRPAITVSFFLLGSLASATWEVIKK